MTEHTPVAKEGDDRAQIPDQNTAERAGEAPAPVAEALSTGNGKQARPRHTPHRRLARGLIPPDLTREDAVRRLEAFYYLAHLAADSNNDVDRLVHAAARLVSDVLGDMAAISLLNMHGETYHIAAFYDPDPEVLSLFGNALAEVADGNIPQDQGWVATVVRTGKPVLLPAPTIELINRQAVPAFADFARRVGITSMLVVPIIGQSGTLGAIAMTRHTADRPYTETDQYFLMEMGYRIGLAIESATLVSSLRNEVSARLFAREALVASEERFLSIFRSSALGIKIMNLVGNILETNSAFQVLSGYPENELIAMHFYDIIHPDDVVNVMKAFADLKVRRIPQAVVDHRLVRPDGSMVWLRTTFASVRKGPGDESLALIFGMAEDITAHKQAEAELLELKRHLQRSIEMERLRLAQNLHDTPLQELYAVIYKLEELRPTTRPATSEIIGQVIGDIKKTLNGLRATASELRPPSLSRFGLEKAIRSYAEDFRQKHPELKLELTLARDGQLLPEEMRLVLFRVLQEALGNVVRHAQASEVRVLFSFDAEEARLEVFDNGKGFNVPPNWMTDLREGHYGLAGMVERISAAGGTLQLESQPGHGTTIRAVIPC